MNLKESSSEDEEESEDLEGRLERRRERRLWLQSRNKLLFNYTQFSYHAGSVGAVCFTFNFFPHSISYFFNIFKLPNILLSRNWK